MYFYKIVSWNWRSKKHIAKEMKGEPTNVLQTAQCSIFIASYMTFTFKNYSWNCIAVSYVTLHAVLQA